MRNSHSVGFRLGRIFPVLMALAACPGMLWANTHGVALAPEVSAAPVLDADLSEWKAPFVHLGVQPPSWFQGKSRLYGQNAKSSSDIESWFAVTWKGDKLYFACAVLDDTIVKSRNADLGQAWNQDSVEAYLSFHHDSPFFSSGRKTPYRADHFQIRFIPFESEKGVKGGVYLGNNGAGISEDKFQKAVKCVSKPFSWGGRPGYVLEASLDAALLGFPGRLKAGQVLGFECAVNDADAAKGRDRMLTWSSFDNRAFEDTSCFGDLLVADARGTFKPPAGADNPEKEGYYLSAGASQFQTLASAMKSPLEDNAAGRVAYALSPPAGAKNISGLFDPNPYRPISGPAIRYSQVGYLPDGKRIAYLECPAGDKPPAEEFAISKGGQEVFRAPLKKWGTLWRRDYYHLDFQAFKGPGEGFSLAVGEVKTEAFPIAEGVYDGLDNLAFKEYFPAQFCGVATSQHGVCHLDDAQQASSESKLSNQVILQFPPVFKPKTQVDVTGGWHDAGDNNKYMGNMPFDLILLSMTYEEFHPDLDLDKNGQNEYTDMIKRGADWCLKMQDRDGGVFERVWNGFGNSHKMEKETDGKPGTGDERLLDSDKWADVTARWASTAAFLAQGMKKTDPAYADRMKKSALKAWEYVEKCPAQPSQPWAFGVYPGNDSCFFWAAVELYRLTREEKYLQDALKRLPAMMDMKPAFMGWAGNNVIAILRLYPALPDGEAKDQVRAWLMDRVKKTRAGEAQNPFGVDYWQQPGWGNNPNLLESLLEMYMIQRIIPGSRAVESLESYRQWIYGANPAGYCFVVGLGSRQVEHQLTALRRKLPGAVVPGIVDDGMGLPFYVDSDGSYVTNEGTIGATAANMFAGRVKAPWKMKPVPQDPADTKREFEKATVKKGKPDPSLLLDLENAAADSFWSGGGGGGRLDKSLVPSAPGGAMAFRGEYKVGQWTMTVMPAGGDLTDSTALCFLVRGSDARLRVGIDDANEQDWGADITAPSSWKAVTLFFTDLAQPSWATDKLKRPLNLKGIKKFRVQPMGPAEGWFEIASIRKMAAPVSKSGSQGLLRLSRGDADSLWVAGGGDYKIEKTIEQGLLRVKFSLGQWCMTGLTGNFKPEGAKGWKFKAKGKGVSLRFAVADGNNRDFGKTLSLTGTETEYTVLFADLVRASWETQDKDAPLDSSAFNQIKLQPTAPEAGEFSISDPEWVR